SRHAVPVYRADGRAVSADGHATGRRTHAPAPRGLRPMAGRPMTRLARYVALTAALLIGVEARGANPPGALDLPPSNVIPAPVDITPGTPARVERSEPSGNPLWAIPLSALTATRERPLFLPSRRAPAPAVAGRPIVAPPPPPPGVPRAASPPPPPPPGAPAPQRPPSATGAPRSPIPGDPRPLEDQL